MPRSLPVAWLIGRQRHITRSIRRVLNVLLSFTDKIRSNSWTAYSIYDTHATLRTRELTEIVRMDSGNVPPILDSWTKKRRPWRGLRVQLQSVRRCPVLHVCPAVLLPSVNCRLPSYAEAYVTDSQSFRPHRSAASYSARCTQFVRTYRRGVVRMSVCVSVGHTGAWALQNA